MEALYDAGNGKRMKGWNEKGKGGKETEIGKRSFVTATTTKMTLCCLLCCLSFSLVHTTAEAIIMGSRFFRASSYMSNYID